MSGGSYDYAFSKVQDMASSLRRQDVPLRRAFAEHLQKVAKAMHALEWVDSCDWARGDEEEHIRACLAPGAELLAAIAMAERAQRILAETLDAAREESP